MSTISWEDLPVGAVFKPRLTLGGSTYMRIGSPYPYDDFYILIIGGDYGLGEILGEDDCEADIFHDVEVLGKLEGVTVDETYI